jgi:hypothetical protein
MVLRSIEDQVEVLQGFRASLPIAWPHPTLAQSKAADLCSWVRGDWVGSKDSVTLFPSLLGHPLSGKAIYSGWIISKSFLVRTYCYEDQTFSWVCPYQKVPVDTFLSFPVSRRVRSILFVFPSQLWVQWLYLSFYEEWADDNPLWWGLFFPSSLSYLPIQTLLHTHFHRPPLNQSEVHNINCLVAQPRLRNGTISL